MLPKVKTALMKRLKPLKFAEPAAPSPDSSGSPGLTTDFQKDPSHEAPSKRAELKLVPSGETAESPQASQQVAPRNGVIEFFGKLRAAKFPVFKWFAVTAYAMANKAARSNGRRKKGILVDKNFE